MRINFLIREKLKKCQIDGADMNPSIKAVLIYMNNLQTGSFPVHHFDKKSLLFPDNHQFKKFIVPYPERSVRLYGYPEDPAGR